MCRKSFMGGELTISAKIKFLSEEHKNRFSIGAGLELSGDRFNIEGDFSSMSTTDKQNSSIEISAIQRGGNEFALLGAIDGNIVSCSLAELGPCRAALNSLKIYAENFRSQLVGIESAQKTSYSNALFYTLTPNDYSNSEPLNSSLATLRKALQSEFVRMTKFKNSIDRISPSEFKLFMPEFGAQSALNRMKSALSRNIGYQALLIDYCFTHPYMRQSSSNPELGCLDYRDYVISKKMLPDAQPVLEEFIFDISGFDRLDQDRGRSTRILTFEYDNKAKSALSVTTIEWDAFNDRLSNITDQYISIDVIRQGPPFDSMSFSFDNPWGNCALRPNDRGFYGTPVEIHVLVNWIERKISFALDWDRVKWGTNDNGGAYSVQILEQCHKGPITFNEYGDEL